MLKHVKISEKQFIVLLSLYIIGSAILVIPSIIVSIAKQDAWITSILTLVIALGILPLYIALGKRYPTMLFTEFTEEILGKWIGKVFSIIFLTFPVIAGSLTLYNIGDFIITQVMPETPIVPIYVFVLSVSLFGVRLGLEVLARSGEILFPWVIALFSLLVLFLTKQINFDHFQPFFTMGLRPIFISTVHFLTFPFLDTVVFLMIFPYVKWTSKKRTPVYIGTLIGGVFLIIIIFLCVLVLGVDQTSTRLSPTYLLAKEINVTNFITRIEVIVAIIWFISIFFKLSILLFVLNLGVAQLFNLTTYRFLTLPLGLLFLASSNIFVPNGPFLGSYTLTTSPFYTGTIGFALPFILFVIDGIKRKLVDS
ncbi:GerAB/ArcD/ProY family transporter [Priestia flexa]|uniref:GerAB/ArcD/ProY family transporter n=1 Tax=Priestia flexa TaxID=86664 RepID=UPI0015C84B6C